MSHSITGDVVVVTVGVIGTVLVVVFAVFAVFGVFAVVVVSCAVLRVECIRTAKTTRLSVEITLRPDMALLPLTVPTFVRGLRANARQPGVLPRRAFVHVVEVARSAVL